ncbi:MAG: hypothetical protein IIC33_10405, partial [Chloroflexi bacterium]|nr:hypothetical protein [Chloroflexota bacterium]
TAALVKATLINSAVDMLDENNDGVNDNLFPIPNGHEGWGRVNLANATDGGHDFVEETTGLSTAASAIYTFQANGTDPFKVSLVWSDYPSTEFVLAIIFGVVLEISIGPNLVNDLDLVVTSPTGIVYTGNNFSEGWTLSGESGADRINNVENVYIDSAQKGTWTVEVYAYNTPFGPQPYALVVDGVVLSDAAPDTEPPRVTVDSPVGTDSLTAGTTHEITWNATDNVGVTSVDLAYSPDGGVTFDPAFATAEINDGVYSWLVPADVGDNAVIKVMAYDADGNMGEGMSAAFAIVDGGGGTPAGTVNITKASYNSKRGSGTLEIQATSSEGASPDLTATYSPGGETPVNMTYNPKKNKWSIKITGISGKPNSVKVCFISTSNCADETGVGGK